MSNVTTCPLCSSTGDLFPLLSVLDFKERRVCASCVDNQAEPPDVVARADHIDPDVFRSVRVFYSRRYLTIDAWLERHEDPTADIVFDGSIRNDDRQLSGLVDGICRMGVQLDLAPKRSPRRRWFDIRWGAHHER